MEKKLGSAIRFSVSLSLIAVLLWLMRGKYNDILNVLKSTNLLLLFAAFLLFCINIFFVTFRLDVIFMGENIRVPIMRLMELNYIGYFFNNFMPSAVGGDIIKAYYSGMLTKEKAKSYVSIFMDRLFGLFSFAFIALIALISSWEAVSNAVVKKSVFIFIILCFFLAIISLNAKMAGYVSRVLKKITFVNLGEKLAKLYDIVHNYRNKKDVIFKTLLISMIAQAIYFNVIYILAKSVNAGMPLKSIFLIMPIVSAISMLPSVGGLGLRESAIVILFGPIIGFDKAFSISILLFAILFLISLVGGIIYLGSPQFRHVKIKGINNH